MSVYKPKGRKNYVSHLNVHDETGGAHRIHVALLPDRAASARAFERLRDAVMRAQSGVHVPTTDVPPFLLKTFYKACDISGLKEYTAMQAAQRPLRDHADEWIASMQYAGRSPVHCKRIAAHLDYIVEATRWRKLTQIDPERLSQVLAGWAVEPGLSSRTLNAYRMTMHTFCEWLTRNGRLPSNPIKRVPTRDERADRRRERRALTVDELKRLIVTTAEIPEDEWSYGTIGLDRSIYYHVAAFTGLRSGELRALERRQFDLDACFVSVRPEQAKNRAAASLPLHPQLVARLRDYWTHETLRGRMLAMRMPSDTNVARVMRKDMVRADINPIDEDGKVLDFHALRHTFATLLAAAGVHPYEAQQLMRHARMETTMQVYTHPRLNDLVRAANSIALPERKDAETDVG